MKERITITLDEELIKRLDQNIDNHRIKNRSHAIEFFLKNSLGHNTPSKALILCGGKGERLRPITYEIPKPLIPIQGKTLIEHLLDLFKKHGVNDIILAVGYKRENIKNYFGNGEKFGVKISYIEEETPLGTAGPLRKAKELLKETFIVANGDELKNIDLEEMFLLHKEQKAMITIALTTVSDPSAYGVADLSGSKILRFVEKPLREEAPSKLINSGLYIMEPEVIELIQEGFSMLERDIFPKIASRGRLFGYPFSGQWFDTGNMDRYETALKEWRGV